MSARTHTPPPEDQVALLPASGRLPEEPMVPGRLGDVMAKRGAASGTVADVRHDGFTVVTGGGTKIRVTTSPDTVVIKQASAAIGDLEIGAFTSAVGGPGPDGSLAATTVQQNGRPSDLLKVPAIDLPRALPGGLPSHMPPKALQKDLFKGLGCDRAAIATAALDTAA